MYKFAIMYMTEKIINESWRFKMKKMLKSVIRFITEDTISHDFNPWLVQRDMDIQKNFM